MQQEFFIFHASVDFESVVQPLAVALESAGHKVSWNVRRTPRSEASLVPRFQSLSSTTKVVVVMSRALMHSGGPHVELREAIAQDRSLALRLVPIWFDISPADLGLEGALLAAGTSTGFSPDFARLAAAVAQHPAGTSRFKEFEGDFPTLFLPACLNGSFKHIFERLGYRVLWAEDHASLVEMARQKKVNIALEWQHHPEGTHTLDLMKELQQDCPVLVCTNFKNWDPEEARLMGFAGVIHVPDTPRAWIAAIETALHYHRLRAHLASSVAKVV